MDITKLVEEINALVEDELVDDFEDIEVSDVNFEDDQPEEIADNAEANSMTDELDAKTKISRALDVFEDAVEDFKGAVFTEIDLIKDADLSSLVENLTQLVQDMRSTLAGNNVEPELIKDDEEVENELTDDNSEEEAEEEEVRELNFDDEASLDLFPEE